VLPPNGQRHEHEQEKPLQAVANWVTHLFYTWKSRR
jgi:hypothetical protein